METREYFKDIGYKPFLFYVVFGVTGEKLQVSKSRHHVDVFPDDLEIHSLCRTNHADYINGFFEGTLGKILKEANRELYEKCLNTEDCAVIKGYIKDDSNLEYMRNVIGIVQAFVEQGAVGVLDLLTFSMYAPKEWEENFFDREITAKNNVVILLSEEQDKYWMHTRGMTKFGRPDFSLHNVDKNSIDKCKVILDYMIIHCIKGEFFNSEFIINTKNGDTYKVKSKFVDDFENDDFNNAYCEVEIIR